jgi:membrane dipeptidase
MKSLLISSTVSKRFIIIFFVLITIHVCKQNNSDNSKDQLMEKAKEIAHKFMIVDTHIDVPYRLEGYYEDISQRTKRGHFDYVRAKEGGLDALFMSIFIPASFEESGGGKEYADKLISMVEGIVKEHNDKFAMAYSVEDLKMNYINGLISIPMGMENGTPIEGDLKNLKYFYDKGIRYITLTHSKRNHISDSSYDNDKKWNGLSPFGVEVVKEMNRLGVIIDISHISDHNSKAPVVATHSSCRHFTPGWERNMNDEMIKTLAYHRGVIMINFGTSFLDNDIRNEEDKHWKNISAILKEKGISFFSPESHKIMDEYYSKNKPPEVTVSKVADHIDHVIKLVGIDYVGFGSDFDGVYFVPKGLDDVSKYPNLIYELLKKGYSEEDIEKICSGNFLRVWKEVEDYASSLKNDTRK